MYQEITSNGMETRQITTIDELHGIAKEILSTCEKNELHVIGLSGDLGAGKTAFTKELGKLLNVENEITSPTFVIMKSYAITGHADFKTLTHIDAYRIESDDEMRVLKLGEILEDRTQLICIEWPEKIQNLMPEHTYTVAITPNLDGTRDITFGA